MTTDQIAGMLLISGATVFGIGAAVGVPQVFTEREPEARLRMLKEHLGVWRVAQPFYGLGPIIASVGSAGLPPVRRRGQAPSVLWTASSVLLVGSLAWAWSVYLRANRISDFAFGRLHGWPFATYVLLTIGGLGLLGVGLLAGGFPVWLGWLVLGADALFLVVYLRFRDIPPFAFYLLIALVGVVVL